MRVFELSLQRISSKLPSAEAVTKGAGWRERRFDPAPVLVVLLFDQIAGGAGEPDHLCV